MADVLTNLATVSEPLQAEYWQRKFLSTLEAELLFNRFGMPGEIAPHGGKNVFWPKMENLAMTVTAQSAASEGKDPDAAALSGSVVSAVMQQYKQWYRLSDLFQSQTLPGTMEQIMQRMAYRGALNIDTIIRNSVFSAGGSSQVAGTAVLITCANRNGSFDLDVQEIREAVRRLRKDNVPTMTDGYYTGILHPYSEFIIELLRLETIVSKLRKLRENLNLFIETICSQTQKWGGSTTIIGAPLGVMG